VLNRNNLVPGRLVDARKEPLAGEEAWQLLAGAREILVATGKNYLTFDPQRTGRDEILARTLGRTGNLRAPALLIGDRLLVGYCEAMYAQFSG
jgi:hypothetical protein